MTGIGFLRSHHRLYSARRLTDVKHLKLSSDCWCSVRLGPERVLLTAGRRSCWRLKPSLSVADEPLGRWKPLAEGPSSSSSGVGTVGAGTAVVSEASSKGVADEGVVSSVPSCGISCQQCKASSCNTAKCIQPQKCMWSQAERLVRFRKMAQKEAKLVLHVMAVS